MEVVAPPRVFQTGWRGGAVLGPLVSERALLAVDEDLGNRVKAMCVIEWLPGDHATWIAGHNARDLRAPNEEPVAVSALDPVVEVAMREAGESINHNNALVTEYEKALAVRTLQVLVKGGYRFDYAGRVGDPERLVRQGDSVSAELRHPCTGWPKFPPARLGWTYCFDLKRWQTRAAASEG